MSQQVTSAPYLPLLSYATYPPSYVHTPPTHPHMFTHHLPTLICSHTTYPPSHHIHTLICSHTTYPPTYVHTPPTHPHIFTHHTYICAHTNHTHTSPDVPDAPTDVSLHVTSNCTLTVKFSEPVHSRGAPITRYKSKYPSLWNLPYQDTGHHQ